MSRQSSLRDENWPKEPRKSDEKEDAKDLSIRPEQFSEQPDTTSV